jgi:hypothetical protein
MDFYQLRYAVGKEIGSTFPQSQHMISELSIDDPRHLWKWSGKLDENVYIPDSILHYKARLTDLISSSPISYPIVSTKLKEVIEPFRKEGIQFLPTNIIRRKEKISYWLMNGYRKDYQSIDFRKSIITLKKRDENGTVSRPTAFKNSEEYVQAINSTIYPEFIDLEKLVFLNDTTEDILIIDRTPYKFFFSQKAKDAIEASKCTGITFEKL